MLSVKNVSYSIKTKKVLENQNVTIEAGQHLLLLGPSGCGKSTLMNIMAGLSKPTAGEITFEDKEYSALSCHDLDILRGKNFGFIFQTLHLIGYLNIQQNIALAQNAVDQSRIKELISQLDLSHLGKQKAHNISVGEAQRVAVARAIANKPKIIFADEPTSALDDENAKNVIEMIFEQAQKTGASIIAATHDERIKSYFTNVMEMRA